MANRMKRIQKLTYIMTPMEGITEKDVIDICRRGCRQAAIEGLEPIAPYLHYAMFMGQDELTSVRIRDRCNFWMSRCSKIWVCLKDNKLPPLDTLTHTLLMGNEHIGMRPRVKHDVHKLPVVFVWWDDLFQHLYMKQATSARMRRWLVCNISNRIITEGDDDDDY